MPDKIREEEEKRLADKFMEKFGVSLAPAWQLDLEDDTTTGFKFAGFTVVGMGKIPEEKGVTILFGKELSLDEVKELLDLPVQKAWDRIEDIRDSLLKAKEEARRKRLKDVI